MAWIDGTYSQIQPCYQDTQNVQIIQQPAPQQPTTIFQQIQSAVPYPSQLIRRAHVKEDLVELMMIQNAQMHQVIMSNMTMSALSSFGYCQAPPATEPFAHPVTVEDESPEICHHYYQPVPLCLCPSWIAPPQPQPGIAYQACSDHQAPIITSLRDRRAIPSPSPPTPRALWTEGPGIPPAAVRVSQHCEGKRARDEDPSSQVWRPTMQVTRCTRRKSL
ncbi:proline-rich protein 29-like isoform X2 [Brienomyrus brachyistius]|uniref:proline-rich protein 29-like isoform X2 n=1 Tax=Brienomyrus brachyistius TaxID=42636 RepID=UPI0020B3A187|nr:proline-rich protein 29-like isoform X2 [Brienomyrus brachyistius]